MDNYATAARMASEEENTRSELGEYWGEWYFNEMDEVTISENYTTDLVMREMP